MMEQTMVLKNVEGDTIKQLQMVDGKTRTVKRKQQITVPIFVSQVLLM